MDFLESVYLCVFGLIMVAFDIPVPIKLFDTIRATVSKFCAFLTLSVGRGIFFLFLGCMTTATLWDNQVSYFLAIVLGLFVVIVGIVSIVMGVIVSQKLQKLKKQAAEGEFVRASSTGCASSMSTYSN